MLDGLGSGIVSRACRDGVSPQSMHANMSLLASPAVLHVIKTGAARYKECLVFLMYA